jgi:hypothetical protein
MDSPSLHNVGDFEIETQQETPWIKKIKELALRIRDRVFSKTPAIEQAQPKPADFMEMTPENIAKLNAMLLDEKLSAKDLIAVHEGLKMIEAETQIADFLKKNLRMIHEINDVEKIFDPQEWESKKSLIIAAYVGRYPRQVSEGIVYDRGVNVSGFGRGKKNTQLPEQEVVAIEQPPVEKSEKVINFAEAAKRHDEMVAKKHSEAEKSEPKSTPPTPEDSEDDLKMA